MLWACLLLPALPLDVFTRAQSPGTKNPFAVTTVGRTPRIVSANDCARDTGIHSGQLVSAALALSPDLVVRNRDPGAESAALAAVATWATQLTPAVALAPPDAVLAEIGGSLRLFGGLPKLAARLSSGARDLGYTARLAFAPTPAAALLFARSEQPTLDFSRIACSQIDFSQRAAGNALAKAKPDADFLNALLPLPLSLTEADPNAVALLAAAGVTTLWQACALPRAALARRVGADFVALLDRVRGLIPDPRPPFVSPPRYIGKIDLPAPVENVEALAFAVNRLVFELAGWLSGRGLGVSEMALALAHERYIGVKTGVPATTVSFALAAPAREPAHLVAVLRERLARVALPAPVEAIRLTSVATTPLASRNLGLLPGENVAATVPLVDRLRARLGEDAVALVTPRAEHRPERAWRDAPVNAGATFGPASAGRSTEPIHRRLKSAPRQDPRMTLPAQQLLLPAARRPVWLFAEPEPLGHRLEVQPWVLRDGPERIESGWWDGTDVRRDYFVTENSRGETVWIYRDHRYGIDDGEWFLHGIFA